MRLACVSRKNQSHGIRLSGAFQGPQVAVHVRTPEDVVAAAIKEEREWASESRRVEQVGRQEADPHSGSRRSPSRPIDGERAEIDAGYFETLLREPDRIRAGSTPQFDRPAGHDPFVFYYTHQLAGGVSRIPRSITRPIVLLPLGQIFHRLRPRPSDLLPQFPV
jgi:hypothetical protein